MAGEKGLDARGAIDISVPIRNEMTVFEGNPQVSLQLQQALAAGDEANVSVLSLGVHTGTHVDSPYHFFNEGSASETLSLEVLIGKAAVIDASSVDGHIDVAALESVPLPDDCRRLLVKTRNSALWAVQGFARDFQGLTVDAAAYLVARGVSLVGWDYLSIGPFADAVGTHKTLLAAGVVILEGINLESVEAGIYNLVCLPLRLEGSDGAPARALLLPLV